MSIDNVLQGLREWCEECGDVFNTEDYEEFVECGGERRESCATLGHHPALTDSDFEWHICDRCRGNGTLGGYPGVYTQDDFAEDPDFFEDYMSYTRSCEDCNGTGKILDLTEAAAQRPIVAEWIQDHYDTEAAYAAERRMGA